MNPSRRPPVSAAATGQVRQLCQQLAAEAAQIIAAAEALPPAMVRAALSKNPIRCRQGMRHVERAMPIRPVWVGQRGYAWRFLRPLGDTIEVQAVLLGAKNRPAVSIESFGLNCCRHAIGRLLDRTGFVADPVRALFEAHDALMRLEPDDGRQVFDLPALPLPAAGGCFLTVREPLDDRPMLSARTWIAADQRYRDQDQSMEIWARFLANDVTHENDYKAMKSKEVQ